jgi:hypothetical protein
LHRQIINNPALIKNHNINEEILMVKNIGIIIKKGDLTVKKEVNKQELYIF